VPLGTSTIASGAASFSTNALPVGTHTITATYNGDRTWTSFSRTLAITIAPASTSTAVSLTLASGQLLVTGSVSPAAPGAGKPTGAVQFVDTSSNTIVGSAILSDGTASVALPASTASTVIGRPIAAVYSSDNNFRASASAPLPVMMSAAAR